MAKVFRAKWFEAMSAHDWKVAAPLPKDWVVDVKQVGNGEKALVYLGRYLYRGVIAEKNILRCQDGQVSFRYTDNQGKTQVRTLAGTEFLWLGTCLLIAYPTNDRPEVLDKLITICYV